MLHNNLNVQHTILEHMNCLTQSAYKVHNFHNKYFLEVFVGSSNADPFIKEDWFRTEVKKFNTLAEAKQYMKENY